ncbi:hypothetical protein ACI79P_17485 [Blastococcus sp. SYSU DS0510]
MLLVGARDLTEAQRAVLHGSGLTWLRDPGAVAEAVAALAARVDAVHVDLDVHDPSVAPANTYAAGDGLRADQVPAVLAATAARIPVLSAALASWDPACDVEGRMLAAALDGAGGAGGPGIPAGLRRPATSPGRSSQPAFKPRSRSTATATTTGACGR